MDRLINLAEYLFNADERLITNLVNTYNEKHRQGWRISSYEYFEYDLLNPDKPERIASLSKLENLLYTLYKLEQAEMNARCYVVERDLGLIPFENVEQAIEETIGLEQFLEVYLQPFFEDEEEYLEDLPEAALYLKDCLNY